MFVYTFGVAEAARWHHRVILFAAKLNLLHVSVPAAVHLGVAALNDLQRQRQQLLSTGGAWMAAFVSHLVCLPSIWSFIIWRETLLFCLLKEPMISWLKLATLTLNGLLNRCQLKWRATTKNPEEVNDQWFYACYQVLFTISSRVCRTFSRQTRCGEYRWVGRSRSGVLLPWILFWPPFSDLTYWALQKFSVIPL